MTKTHIALNSALIERVRAVAGQGSDAVEEFVEEAIRRALPEADRPRSRGPG